MQTKDLSLGVIDSGVGGLSVVRELQRVLPHENIIFVSDSANCPYGNLSAAQISSLTCRMLSFLEEKKVKCTAVACNTISTLAEELRRQFAFPISSIVEAATQLVMRENLECVGLIATEFTVKSGKYQQLLRNGHSNCRIIAKGSPLLAALIEHRDLYPMQIQREICDTVDAILAQESLSDLILGCTHYPLVSDIFTACYPQLRLIDPAAEQAQSLRTMLSQKGLLSECEQGTLSIYTTGDPKVYADLCVRLGIGHIKTIEKVQL